MAESIGSIPMNVAANAARVAAPAPSTPKIEQPAQLQSQSHHISPSLRVDPIAGVVITEYFNSDGEVQTQIPSAASLAYLRVGMTASGVSSAEEQVAPTKPVEEPKEVVA